MAAAKEINIDAAVAAVLAELDEISALKEGQRTALRAFSIKDVLALLLTGFGYSLVKQRSTLRLG